MLKWIEIDTGVITENARIIRRSLNPGVGFAAVVKANGYGHGAVQAAIAAIEGGADRLAVLTAEEGATLRAELRSERNGGGIYGNVPITLLAPSLPEEAESIVKNRLVPCADSLDFLATLDQISERDSELLKNDMYFSKIHDVLSKRDHVSSKTDDVLSKIDHVFSKIDDDGTARYPVIIETDLGMARWGIPPNEVVDFVQKARSFKHIRIAGISTHLGYRPPENLTDAEEKLRLFADIAAQAEQILGYKIEAAAANSTVLCDISGSQFDVVRIGNLMYGIYPTDIYKKRRGGPPLPGLRRPWQMYARIISIKNIRKGEKIGYNSEFTAPNDMRIAAIPAGYSDGLTMEPMEYKIRIVSGFRYWAMINGKKAYFVGKPGISHTLLDVTDNPEATVGTVVALHVRRTSANILIPRIYKN